MSDHPHSPPNRLGKAAQLGNRFISFLRRKEEASNLKYAIIATMGFLVPTGLGYGADYLWDKYGPEDPVSQKLADLESGTQDIQSGVEAIRSELAAFQSEIPEAQFSEITRRLDEITTRANAIVPEVKQIAAAGKDYIAGLEAQGSAPPYLTKGIFYHNDPRSFVSICGDYLLSFDYVTITLSATADHRARAAYEKPLYLDKIRVIADAKPTPDKGRLVSYDCNFKAEGS